MATEKSGGNSELVEQMQQEFQEHLKGVFEKNKDFKYSDGLTAENFEEVSQCSTFTCCFSWLK